MQCIDEFLYISYGSIRLVDGAVVGDVIAHVVLWGCEYGREPERVDA